MNLEQFLAAYDQCPSHGWLAIEEAMLLVSTAEKTTGPIVEVGSYQGRSACLLGQLGRTVHCVDPWDDNFSSDLPGEEIRRRFLHNVQSIKPPIHIVSHRMKIEDWQPFPAELVYLDGDHTYEGTIRQVQKALECRPKWIAIHDVSNGGDGLHIARAAESMLGRWRDLRGTMAVWQVRL